LGFASERGNAVNYRLKCISVFTIFLIALFAGSAFADVDGLSQQVHKPFNKAFTGDELIMTGPSFGASAFAPDPQPPGDTVGCTYYDYWQNGTIGRNIAFSGVAGQAVHFVWMHTGTAGGARTVRYNAYTPSTNTWQFTTGCGGGKSFTSNNGGYTSCDFSSLTGAVVVAWHQGPAAALYQSKYGIDNVPPTGAFTPVVAPFPPNCQLIQSGNYEDASTYVWPKVDWQFYNSTQVVHMVSTEGPPDQAETSEIQSIIYYRYVDGVLDNCPAPNTDSVLGLYIDETYTVNALVRSDPTSDRVAIVYLKAFYPEDDPMDPCGWTQWQNDVVYLESTDAGLTWGTLVNVTDYSEGGTLQTDEIEYKAYADLTAIYDASHNLHIVWCTPVYEPDGDSPCVPLFATKLWHWSSNNAPGVNISTVYDASVPRFHCASGFGAFNQAAAKMNLAICDGNVYVSFTRFGAHTFPGDPGAEPPVDPDPDVNDDCSDDNFANGDIFVTASSYNGITWGPNAAASGDEGDGTPWKTGTAVDLTNTKTDACAAGDCHNEHWSSMAQHTTGNLHLLYLDDNDAGAGIRGDEGEQTQNAVKYMTYPCFQPEGTFGYTYSPEDQFIPIAPQGGVDCTVDETATFTLRITNRGNVPITYTLTETETWLSLSTTTGTITAGVNTVLDVTVTVGPYATEATLNSAINVDLQSSDGSANFDVDVEVRVVCLYYDWAYETLSTSCWSVGVWNVPRSGIAQRGDLGNMWWFLDSISVMYDNGVVVSYADDLTQTFFSIFDGSDSEVEFVPLSLLETETFPTYEYATGDFATPDTQITGTIEYYLPIHPDTCVLIEKVTLCNNTDAPFTIHVGEGIDWDIPDDNDGSVNRGGTDGTRNMVYQYGEAGSEWENAYGAVAFAHDIAGAVVFENDVWVYPNSGYQPDTIGMLLDTLSVLAATDSIEDLSSFYAVCQDITLGPDSCIAVCKVKASSLIGLFTLRGNIDKGLNWITDNGINCEGCDVQFPKPGGGPTCVAGDANGSGGVDIDDVVYLIGYIFSGGPPPVEANCCGDANGSCGVDIDDVVYLIGYIFSGGPAPLDACGTCPPF